MHTPILVLLCLVVLCNIGTIIFAFVIDARRRENAESKQRIYNAIARHQAVSEWTPEALLSQCERDFNDPTIIWETIT